MPPSLTDRLQSLLGTAFRLDRELTGGGMSRVFVAHEPALKREVVVKVLPPDLVTRESVARFEREVAVTAQLQHPHILPIITTGGADDIYYYVAPYIHGESLRARLGKDGKIPFEETVRLVSELLGAVGFAHARGIIHRDIKPGNILLAEGHAILADFGIARALAGPDDGRLTMTGGAMGTPSYMAPEQPRDEQADLYAVAVVAHEMLTGALPKGRGDIPRTTSEIATAVPRAEASRAKGVAAVLARAMSIDSAKRFRTAREFRDAFEVAGVRAGTRRATIALVATAAVLGGVAIWQAVRPPKPVTAPSPAGTLLAVFPPNRVGSDSLAAGADELAQRLSAAIEGWSDVHVLAPARVREALGSKATLLRSDVNAAARKLGVDRAVTGEIGRRGDTVTFTASLQLVEDGSSFRTLVASFVPGTPSETRELRRLASALFRDGAEMPWPEAGDARRASLAAWQAYDSAGLRLREWNLVEAARLYRFALSADPEITRAHVRLAEIARWSGEPRDSVVERESAEKALAVAGRLGALDSALSEGALALSTSRWPAACSSFEYARALDSLSFAANYGAGECRARDNTVVASRTSPTGFAFRAGWESAARSYGRALATVSGRRPAFVFTRLQQVRSVDRGILRGGRLVEKGTAMAAYPVLIHDTIGYWPVSFAGELAVPATRDSALATNLRSLMSQVSRWVSESPDNADAHLRFAELLELNGNIDTSPRGQDGVTALAEISAARRVNRDSVTATTLVNASVRLLIKVDSFAAARSLGDSALRMWRRPSMEQAAQLIGVAAVIGRVERVNALLRQLINSTARMVRDSRREAIELPASLSEVRAGYLTRAAFGICDEFARRAPRRVEELVDAAYPAASRPAGLVGAIVESPASALAPCGDVSLARPDSSIDPLINVQRVLARGDTAGARARFAAVQAGRKQLAPGAIPFAVVLLEARTGLAVGDSAGVIEQLRRSLDGLLVAPRSLLRNESEGAALVRVMAMYSQLHSGPEGVKWGRAVEELWSSADAEARSVIWRGSAAPAAR